MTLDRALTRRAARLLERRHRDRLGTSERVVVRGHSRPEGVELSLALDGDPLRVEIDVQVAVPRDAPDPGAALDLALDAADALFGEWLEGGRPQRHPDRFVDATYEGRTLAARVRVTRPDLETAADRLLDEEP